MNHYHQYIASPSGSFSAFPDGSFVAFRFSDGRQRYGTIVYFDMNIYEYMVCCLASREKIFAPHHTLQPCPCVTLHDLGQSSGKSGFILGFGYEVLNTLAIHMPEEPNSLFLVKSANAILLPRAKGVLHQLVSGRHLNGRTVTVVGWNGQVNRYQVELIPSRHLNVKPENILPSSLTRCPKTYLCELTLVTPTPALPTAGPTIASMPEAKCTEGQVVRYTSSNGDVTTATILKVHFDDKLEPYYDIRLASGAEKQTDDNHLSMCATTPDAASSNVSGRGGSDTRNDENLSLNIPTLQDKDVTLTSFDYLHFDALKELCKEKDIDLPNRVRLEKKVVVSLLAKRYPDPRPIIQAQALGAFTKPALQEKCGVHAISDCGGKAELVDRLQAALSAMQK